MKRKNLELISKYLEEAKDWVTAEELAAVLHTTTRTVRNYIQSLREDNEGGDGQPVISASPKGYRWNHSLKTERPDKTKNSLDLPEGREIYLLKKLSYREHMTLDEMMEAFCISDYTIEGDIQKIKEIMKKYGLILKKRGDQYFIIGKEIARRSLLAFSLCENRRITYLNYQILERFFPSYDVKDISVFLRALLNESGMLADEYHFYSLLYHIFIQLDRMVLGRTVRESELADFGIK